MASRSRRRRRDGCFLQAAWPGRRAFPRGRRRIVEAAEVLVPLSPEKQHVAHPAVAERQASPEQRAENDWEDDEPALRRIGRALIHERALREGRPPHFQEFFGAIQDGIQLLVGIVAAQQVQREPACTPADENWMPLASRSLADFDL